MTTTTRFSSPFAGVFYASFLVSSSLWIGCGGSTPPTEGPLTAATSSAQTTTKAPVEPCAILAINDTYRIESLPGDQGGMARVRTLRKKLEKEYRKLVVLHAGDMLFPSFLSNMYKGKQMIDALNRLDGVAGGMGAFDDQMFATFGNHEFEKSDPSILSARISEAEFGFISSNVHFQRDAEGKIQVPVPDGRIKSHTIVPCGGVKLGIFGLTINVAQPPYVTIDTPIEIARMQSTALRREGADVVLALTHLSMTEDQKLLETLQAEGPDLSVGGHEHNRQKAEVSGRAVYKADADARSANVIRIDLVEGKPRISQEWVMLESPNYPEDPDLGKWVAETMKKHEDTYCEQNLKLPPGSRCLAQALATAGEDLISEEMEIRRFETNFGDWIADRALGAFPKAKTQPQVAFVNSGTLRLNLDLPKGTTITRRHIEELFAYPTPLRLIEITGDQLQKAVNQSIESWTGEGHFLQIAGFAFAHDTTAHTATKLTLLGDKPRGVQPTDKIVAVAVDFLINPKAGNQDGYTFWNPVKILAEGPDLKDLVLRDLAALQKDGKTLAPKLEGRICTTGRTGPCLALTGSAK